jgi:hypothetical protein
LDLRGDAQYFRLLFDGQPAEKAQFDNPALLRVECGQRVVQGEHIVGLANGHFLRRRQ